MKVDEQRLLSRLAFVMNALLFAYMVAIAFAYPRAELLLAIACEVVYFGIAICLRVFGGKLVKKRFGGVRELIAL